MVDENILVRDRGSFARPSHIKTGTGQDVDKNRCYTSEIGLGDHLARDDEHALSLARDIIGGLGYAGACEVLVCFKPISLP